MGEIVVLAPRLRAHEPAPPEPNPFDFWVDLLDPLSARERQAVIAKAHRHGVIDDFDADTLKCMWPDREGAR